jgi:hypothetical protein
VSGFGLVPPPDKDKYKTVRENCQEVFFHWVQVARIMNNEIFWEETSRTARTRVLKDGRIHGRYACNCGRVIRVHRLHRLTQITGCVICVLRGLAGYRCKIGELDEGSADYTDCPWGGWHARTRNFKRSVAGCGVYGFHASASCKKHPLLHPIGVIRDHYLIYGDGSGMLVIS